MDEQYLINTKKFLDENLSELLIDQKVAKKEVVQYFRSIKLLKMFHLRISKL